jgi:hypothetical protein
MIYAADMTDDTPGWKRAFDEMESRVGPQLEQYVRTEQFADMAASFTRAQAEVQKRIADTMRQAWHFWNLPAASDVQRLSEQVASLERRVRELTKQLEEQEGSRNDEQPVRPSRDRRPHTT